MIFLFCFNSDEEQVSCLEAEHMYVVTQDVL